MTIINKLACSLGRRDEVPNQELAQQILKSKNKKAVSELVENLANKNKGIRYDCIKVLYEVGYERPKLIAGHHSKFLDLLNSKDNRLQWGAMTALGCVVNEKPAAIFAALPKIIAAADRGSVITRDHCVNILIALSSDKKYAADTFPELLKQLATSPVNQLPMYAERSISVVSDFNRGQFLTVLDSRAGELEKESQRKRIEKVLKKVAK